MMRRVLGAILWVTLAATGTAWGQSLNTEVQHFHPAADGQGIIVTESAKVLGLWKPAFGLWFNYANKPLVLYQIDQSTGQAVGDPQNIVGGQLAMDLQAGIGFKYADLTINMPINLLITGADNLSGQVTPASGAAAGDLRITPKGMFIDPAEKKFGLGVVVPIVLPTGDASKYAGDAEVRIVPQVTLGYQGLKFRTFLNMGAQIRPTGAKEAGLLDLSPGNEFVFSWGMGIRAHEKVEILTDLWGGIGGTKTENPVEWTLGMAIHPVPAFALRFGLGTALSPGYGAPAFRGYFSAGVAFQTNDDKDGDGIADAKDQCPAEPEDIDGFEDGDGCPDSDNDGDGILDEDDECPDEPEVVNGFDDDDGCPDESESEIVETPDLEDLPEDLDADGDGVSDENDDCPADPEDPDGFEDKDGCPDLDNDNDGVGDALDDCPDEPEVFNAFQDEDGCPDEGLVMIEKKGTRIARIAILEKVFFEVGKTTIKPESYPVLDAVHKVLRAYEVIRLLEIQGHTDADGPANKNMELSQGRAEAVREYLMEKGTSADRLTAQGYGETMPIDSNKSAEGKANNRRVEFVVLEQE